MFGSRFGARNASEAIELQSCFDHHKRKLLEIKYGMDKKKKVQMRSEKVHDFTMSKILNNRIKNNEFRENEKIDVIRRENQKLLEKLLEISRGKSLTTGGSYKKSKIVGPRSLNYLRMKHTAEKIDEENQKLLHRIITKEPTLAKRELDDQYSMNKRYLQHINKERKYLPTSLKRRGELTVVSHSGLMENTAAYGNHSMVETRTRGGEWESNYSNEPYEMQEALNELELNKEGRSFTRKPRIKPNQRLKPLSNSVGGYSGDGNKGTPSTRGTYRQQPHSSKSSGQRSKRGQFSGGPFYPPGTNPKPPRNRKYEIEGLNSNTKVISPPGPQPRKKVALEKARAKDRGIESKDIEGRSLTVDERKGGETYEKYEKYGDEEVGKINYVGGGSRGLRAQTTGVLVLGGGEMGEMGEIQDRDRDKDLRDLRDRGDMKEELEQIRVDTEPPDILLGDEGGTEEPENIKDVKEGEIHRENIKDIRECGNGEVSGEVESVLEEDVSPMPPDVSPLPQTLEEGLPTKEIEQEKVAEAQYSLSEFTPPHTPPDTKHHKSNSQSSSSRGNHSHSNREKKDSSDNLHKSDISVKSEKPENSHKSEKSAKSEKSYKSDKSEKSEKSEISHKSGKSENSNKSGKSNKSSTPNSDKSYKSESSVKMDKWSSSSKSEGKEIIKETTPLPPSIPASDEAPTHSLQREEQTPNYNPDFDLEY